MTYGAQRQLVSSEGRPIHGLQVVGRGQGEQGINLHLELLLEDLHCCEIDIVAGEDRESVSVGLRGCPVPDCAVDSDVLVVFHREGDLSELGYAAEVGEIGGANLGVQFLLLDLLE